MKGGSNKRLAGAGRRVEDDVLPLEQRQDGLLLGRVQVEAERGDVVQEPAEQVGWVERVRPGQEVVQRSGDRTM
jgi:hypothetical protein